MAKTVTQTFNNPSEISYTEFAPGDLVYAPRESSGGLDIERIYQVESATPPTDIRQMPAGIVKLKHRPTTVYSINLREATEENFKDYYANDPKTLEYFLTYLAWIKEGDRFS